MSSAVIQKLLPSSEPRFQSRGAARAVMERGGLSRGVPPPPVRYNRGSPAARPREICSKYDPAYRRGYNTRNNHGCRQNAVSRTGCPTQPRST